MSWGEDAAVGDWLFHCHRLHHIHNNMGITPVPGEPMHHGEGGMFTKLVVSKPNMGDSGHDGHGDGGHDGHDMGDMGGGGSHGGHNMKMFPKPGQYIGTIDTANGAKVLANVNIFKVQSDHEWRKLKVTMKLHLGDFASDEYITYTFDQIDIDWNGGKLHLEDSVNGVRLVDFRLEGGGHGGHGNHGGGMDDDNDGGIGGGIENEDEPEEEKSIKGTFQFNAGRISSDMTLVSIHSPVAQHVVHMAMADLAIPLDAKYQGTCGDKVQRMVLFTGRNSVRQENTRNPYDPYRIGGALGGITTNARPATIEYGVRSGSYDFFRGKVRLNLAYGTGLSSTKCSFKGGTLTCDNDCTLKRERPYPFSTLLPPRKKPNQEFVLEEESRLTQLSPAKRFAGHNVWIHSLGVQ